MVAGSRTSNFYPRSPCGERLLGIVLLCGEILFLSTLSLRRATLGALWVLSTQIFLSTLSLRRATSKRFPPMCFIKHFYPRSPCGERRLTDDVSTGGKIISIHALLAESDLKTPCVMLSIEVFLSTLSLRRATPPVREIIQWEGIFLSTLSLRRATSALCSFGGAFAFLSTLSLRRATIISQTNRRTTKPFLSTLSLRRATNKISTIRITREYFYPRSPCGERLFKISFLFCLLYFYPRSPCGERRH